MLQVSSDSNVGAHMEEQQGIIVQGPKKSPQSFHNIPDSSPQQATNLPRQLVRSTDGVPLSHAAESSPEWQLTSSSQTSCMAQAKPAQTFQWTDVLGPHLLCWHWTYPEVANVLAEEQTTLLVPENTSFQPSLSQDSSISQPCKHTRRPPPPTPGSERGPGHSLCPSLRSCILGRTDQQLTESRPLTCQGTCMLCGLAPPLWNMHTVSLAKILAPPLRAQQIAMSVGCLR